MKNFLYGLFFALVILEVPVKATNNKTLFFTNQYHNIANYRSSEVKRIYCSVKSLGFDIHFNSQTGDIYSFDDFSEELIPFNLRQEIPFGEIIPKKNIQEILEGYDKNVKGPITSIKNNKLMIRISNRADLSQSIIASIDLYNLQLKFKVNGFNTEDRTNIILALNQAEGMIKCEYITPESIIIRYEENNNYQLKEQYIPRY